MRHMFLVSIECSGHPRPEEEDVLINNFISMAICKFDSLHTRERGQSFFDGLPAPSFIIKKVPPPMDNKKNDLKNMVDLVNFCFHNAELIDWIKNHIQK